MLDRLDALTVCDPACGSGAFLNAAYQWFEDHRLALLDDLKLAEPDAPECEGHREDWRARSAPLILANNLFGVDLSAESVEIAQLSLWIATARRGQPLTDLSANVRRGNSVVSDPAVDPLAFDWKAGFPQVFERGGFDAVVGNPPYVRQERLGPIKPHLQAHFRAYHGMADLYVYFYERGLDLLRPGGRLAFVVTNKWLKAGYGEPLRRLLSEHSWVEAVVDFGHAKPFFKDADVFPCFLVARKPNDGPRPETARVCVIPREQVRLNELKIIIAPNVLDVPLSNLGAEAWNLEPLSITDLIKKFSNSNPTLAEFTASKPFRGILTGFNEAFLIDSQARRRLIDLDPSCSSIIKPYLRGQDIKRWSCEPSELWMIALKSSSDEAWAWSDRGDEAEAVFGKTFPSIYLHFIQFKDQMIARQDRGRYWWELRACAYWNQFDVNKVFYQEIQFHPSYCLDTSGRLGNNKTFFLPTDDLYVLGVLNSPIAWWHNWRHLPHMKDEALTPVAYLMESLPIAQPCDPFRYEVESAVRRLIQITQQRQTTRRDILDWLKVEYDIEAPSQKLQAPTGLDSDGFVAAVQKARGKSRPLSAAGLKGLREEYARTIEPARALAAEALGLERRVSDLVNAAYGLTPEEVALMWATAPPRMPIPPPEGP